MESLQHTQSRLRAVKNVGTITKAMEVVAATKMRKSQEVALRARPYAIAALHLLRNIAEHAPTRIPLMEERAGGATLAVIVSSDRGLAGSFNTQVMRVADAVLARGDVRVVTVGKKARMYALKKGVAIIESFSGFGDFISYDEIEPLANHIIDGYRAGLWNRVLTVSTHFRTTLKQETLIRAVLPTNYEKIQETLDEILPEQGRFAELRGENGVQKGFQVGIDYIFEPSVEAALEELVPVLIATQIFHLVLEANASEHSARMVAMKTASDNARELVGDLTRMYNKARQAGITKEMIEIISTQNAL